jgi:hypothetical protein
MRDGHTLSLRRLRHALADSLFGTIGLLSLALPDRTPRLLCTCEEANPGGPLLGDVTSTLRALRDNRTCDHHPR